jgi:hypothetical protein
LSRRPLAIVLAPFFMMGCGKTVIAPSPPVAELACPRGEEPAAVNYYNGNFTWKCSPSPPPCSAGQERVWAPVHRYASYAVEATTTCRPRCAEAQERQADGLCPPTERELAEDRELDRARAAAWRSEHPGQACLHDCAAEARQCVKNCYNRGNTPACASDCQNRADACSSPCRGLPP